mmetsp:Transcript_110615/g.219936  ORF Transcript_110615/g.219936 Transcript_110615/m.219936 type:complete len:82 (+) Transcript_110615:291-536(+)
MRRHAPSRPALCACSTPTATQQQVAKAGSATYPQAKVVTFVDLLSRLQALAPKSWQVLAISAPMAMAPTSVRLGSLGAVRA